jgi:peptidoglycan/xylan/chitin deacetylase (PgdA/CDA1 family)
MSLSQPMVGAPDAPDPGVWGPKLASKPSPLVRARSRALREIAAHVLPRSVYFAHGPRRAARKRVALTFDDGPDEMTAAYLDVLAELDARATFFLVGEQVARSPGCEIEYLRRGHELGGHGWTHEPFPAMTSARLGDELARMDAVLPWPKGLRPLVRPPRGILSPRALVRLAAAGYVTVLWSLDSDDCRTSDSTVVERRLHPANVAPGEVVLLHEMQPWTLKALPGVIRGLRDAGYELVTVSELMRGKEDGNV